MEQSPSWEANRWSADQDVPRSLSNRKFISTFTSARHMPLFCARRIQSMPPSHFLKIHFNIILPSKSRSSKWFLYLRSAHQNAGGQNLVLNLGEGACLNKICWAKRLYFALGSGLLLIFFSIKMVFVKCCHEVEGRTFLISSRKTLFGQAVCLTLRKTFKCSYNSHYRNP